MPKKYLITGCGGFLGSHLANHLLDQGQKVFGTYHHKKITNPKVTALPCDFKNQEAVRSLVSDVQPDTIYHFAAQSQVMPSWQDFEGTIQANVVGTYYLLEAVRQLKPNCRIIIAGSSAEYGSQLDHEVNLSEDRAMKPVSPYGVSKVAQDLLGHIYFKSLNLPVIRIIPFYILGPGKEPDATSDFLKAIIAHRQGKTDRLFVGNLRAIRDIVDIRDAVQALELFEKRGELGTAYNIASGKGTSLQEILDTLLQLAGSKIKILVDQNKFRPGDENKIVGNPKRLEDLGWKPKYQLEETLQSILDYWAERLG